eukprot:7262187-Prymnesium_polylepis.1
MKTVCGSAAAQCTESLNTEFTPASPLFGDRLISVSMVSGSGSELLIVHQPAGVMGVANDNRPLRGEEAFGLRRGVFVFHCERRSSDWVERDLEM